MKDTLNRLVSGFLFSLLNAVRAGEGHSASCS